MPNYTYVQLKKITGKSVHTLRNTVYKLQIKNFLIKGVVHFDKQALETLENHFSPKTLENSKRKIRVIESYLKHQSCRSVSKYCRVPKQAVSKIVEEWSKDETITVESSMNYSEKIQNKGIFKKGAKWGFQIVNKGVKYYKSGFTCEKDAVDALYLLKESFK